MIIDFMRRFFMSEIEKIEHDAYIGECKKLAKNKGVARAKKDYK